MNYSQQIDRRIDLMSNIVIYGGRSWNGVLFEENKELVYTTDTEKDLKLCLREDDLLLPGIIDMHAHLWAPPAVSSFGNADELYFADGIVGAVDCGTYGVNDWKAANRFWQNASLIRIKSYVSVLPEGLTIFPPVTPTTPDKIDVEKYVELIGKNRDTALGIKVQLGWLPYKSVETDKQLLDICSEVAQRTGTSKMVHISGQKMAAQDSANAMQPGDFITHPYSGFENTILDNDGKVYQEIFAARDRGVLFDVGYAGKHFSWKVFRKAFDQGLKFDTLGMDMGTMSYKTPNSIVIDHFHVLSGLLNAGVPEEEVFAALTTNPGKILGFTPGFDKACLVLRKEYGETAAVDGQGDSLQLSFEYKPVLVINNGKLLQNKLQ